MRLVCPNCEAKYEVPDDAIPDTGRDVQCTNCNHSWYQMRGRTGAVPMAAPAAVEPAGMPAPEEAAPVVVDQESAAEDVAGAGHSATGTAGGGEAMAAPVADQRVAQTLSPLPADDHAGAPAAEPKPVTVATDPAPATEVVAIETVDEDFGARPAAPAEVAEAATVAPVAPVDAEADDAPGPAPDYAVDDSVLAILREEAEREANARRAEALESQTDLGLDAAMPRKGMVEADARPAARRDLLPDVEEINSTLRPSEMQAEADATPDFVPLPPEAPRGFRSGFLSLMTIAILGAALYLVAPRLALLVPSLEGPLQSYVSMIDSLRLGLDGMMRSATVAISDG